MNDKKKLVGGNMSSVYQQGDTVVRKMGHWSPTIHRLLQHLEQKGFTDCPKFLGVTGEKEEILTFVPGACLEDYPLNISDAKHLKGVALLAKKMRQFHDATASFPIREDDEWLLTYQGNLMKDVICHNDIAPYNVTFEDGLPKGFIDFDTCAPAPRIWDIVYALYRFVPFTKNNSKMSMSHKFACVETFFQNYGMPIPDDLFIMMAQRLMALADFIKQEADAGNEIFVKMLIEGHDDFYINEANDIKEINHQFYKEQ